MGYRLCSQGNHEELFPGESFVENSQGNGRDPLGRVVRANEIVHHPVNVQRPLQSHVALRIGVRLPAERGIATAKGTVESLAVVGMDGRIFNILHGFGMLREVRHVFSASLVGLGPFVLHPDFRPFLERLAGASPLAGMEKLMADLEQDVTIPSFSVRDQGEVRRLGNELTQGPEGFPEEQAILPAAPELPQEAAGPVHKHHGPPEGLIGGHVFLNPCVDLVSFDSELEVTVEQSVEHQGLLDLFQMKAFYAASLPSTVASEE